MVLKRPPEAGDILQETLDMLILRTLVLGPAHGHTIAQAIERGDFHCETRVTACMGRLG
jgi:PadR family transcriptional regulator PadR